MYRSLQPPSLNPWGATQSMLQEGCRHSNHAISREKNNRIDKDDAAKVTVRGHSVGVLVKMKAIQNLHISHLVFS